MYEWATRLAPSAMAGLLNSWDWKRLASNPKQALDLRPNLLIKGEVETVRKLSEQGTLVVVPTHVSNLDSIVLGYAAYLMGMPPLTYGAGLNLFSHRVLGFFMNRLGAYKVDRLKQAPLYKNVLKSFATRAIELGYHNLFFPGGTRIRSGQVERRLKKGLLGTGLRAYMNNLRSNAAQPNVYVVPCTISYGLVLEAETLIEDHLKETGKARYIISDDEFSKPRRVAQFLQSLIKMDSRIYITFGTPLDPFGNRVDFQGQSRDACDRPVDIQHYVCRQGNVVEDEQRDREYTGVLGDAVVREFQRNNRVQSTNVVAQAMYELIQHRYPEADPYRQLRLALDTTGYTHQALLKQVDSVLSRVRTLEKDDQLRLAPKLLQSDGQSVLAKAVRLFGAYHTKMTIRQSGDRVFTDQPQLVLYYRNRLSGYAGF